MALVANAVEEVLPLVKVPGLQGSWASPAAIATRDTANKASKRTLETDTLELMAGNCRVRFPSLLGRVESSKSGLLDHLVAEGADGANSRGKCSRPRSRVEWEWVPGARRTTTLPGRWCAENPRNGASSWKITIINIKIETKKAG